MGYEVIYGKEGRVKTFNSKIKAAKFALSHPYKKKPILYGRGDYFTKPEIMSSAKRKLRRQRSGYYNPFLGIRL